MRGPVRQARIRALLTDQRGASAMEYGLILALIFLAVMGGVSLLGESVRGRWDDISNKVTSI
ncbi:pilus assembly protein [Sphingomonas sp. Root710]|nr:Flp family type IVb pilin [Sphingomonas sp. Root710]KRB85712.1 pilus assembly protein [Sphingomonas sp. Root710]